VVAAGGRKWMKLLSWLIALCGLWEAADLAAFFVPGFGEIQAFVANHIAVGIVLMMSGAWAALTRKVAIARTLHWIAVAAGVWLIVAPFILGQPAIAAGLWNDILVGIVVVSLGAWAALARPRAAP
jgi:hypothetical protein